MSRRYRIETGPRVRKALGKLDRQIAKEISTAIDDLAAEPRGGSTKRLSGQHDLWRLRVRDYRVIYRIDDQVLIILLVEIQHRSKAYRDL